MRLGADFLARILEQSGANLSPGLRGVYAAALQAALDAGTGGNTALAAILMNASSIRQTVQGHLMNLSRLVGDVRDALEQPGHFDAVITLDHQQTHDAADGDFLYALRFDGVRIANIVHFAAGDALDVRGAAGGSSLLITSDAVSELNLLYGDVQAYSNVWVLNLRGQDADFVAEVMARPSGPLRLAALNQAWGEWLIRGSAGDFDVTVTLTDHQTHDAADGDIRYELPFTGGVRVANILNFALGDAIDVRVAPAGSRWIISSEAPTQLSLVYGDLETYGNTWVLNLNDQDAELVAAIMVEADNPAAQMALLNAAWGDWLLL